MKHARDDYNRIQDPENKIPDDEPVFLLRGQDLSAPKTLEYWAKYNQAMGGDKKLIGLALKQAKKMREWQLENGAKTADL